MSRSGIYNASVTKIALVLGVGLCVLVVIAVMTTSDSDAPTPEEPTTQEAALARVEWLKLQTALDQALTDLGGVGQAHPAKSMNLQEQLRTLDEVVMANLVGDVSAPTDEFAAQVDSLADEVRSFVNSSKAIARNVKPDEQPAVPRPVAVDYAGLLARAEKLVTEGSHSQALDVLFPLLDSISVPPDTHQSAAALFDRTISAAPDWWIITPTTMASSVDDSLLQSRVLMYVAMAHEATGDRQAYARGMETLVEAISQIDTSHELLQTGSQTALEMVIHGETTYSRRIIDVTATALGTSRDRNFTFDCSRIAGVYSRLGEKEEFQSFRAKLKNDGRIRIIADCVAGRSEEAWMMLEGDGKKTGLGVLTGWGTYKEFVTLAYYAAVAGDVEMASKTLRKALGDTRGAGNVYLTGMAARTESHLGQFEKAEARIRNISDPSIRASCYGELAYCYAKRGDLPKAIQRAAASAASVERADAAFKIGQLMVQQNARPSDIAAWLLSFDEEFARYAAAAGVYSEVHTAKRGAAAKPKQRRAEDWLDTFKRFAPFVPEPQVQVALHLCVASSVKTLSYAGCEADYNTLIDRAIETCALIDDQTEFVTCCIRQIRRLLGIGDHSAVKRWIRIAGDAATSLDGTLSVKIERQRACALLAGFSKRIGDESGWKKYTNELTLKINDADFGDYYRPIAVAVGGQPELAWRTIIASGRPKTWVQSAEISFSAAQRGSRDLSLKAKQRATSELARGKVSLTVTPKSWPAEYELLLVRTEALLHDFSAAKDRASKLNESHIASEAYAFICEELALKGETAPAIELWDRVTESEAGVWAAYRPAKLRIRHEGQEEVARWAAKIPQHALRFAAAQAFQHTGS